jgi:hypothetical protein
LVDRVRAWKNRRYFRRMFGEEQAAVRRALFGEAGPIEVATGPFRGMRYFDETVWGPIAPKWLGSYECELHRVIGAIVERGYERVIDVGCAEGYYAVGLARAMGGVRVWAFDTDPVSRGQLGRLAAMNGVEGRIAVGRRCGFADLERLAGVGAVVVCDIEGGEVALLDPSRAPALRRTDILVEVHATGAGQHETEERLRERFGGSHRIERIVAEGREPWAEAQGVLGRMSAGEIARAADERRGELGVWFWMESRG